MINRVEIEGLDRTGKDTLAGYIDYMSNRTMVVKTRGVLSNLVFGTVFDRHIPEKRIEQMIEGNMDTLIVFLTANLDDWKIRMKMSKHPEINDNDHTEAFTYWKNTLREKGIKILEYNTTDETPYRIAEKVMAIIEEENKL